MKRSVFGALALGLTLAVGDIPSGGMPQGMSLIREAQAIVGRPLTPVSVAGVARRTTRRVIVATTIYVATLPPACTVIVIENVKLHQCGTTYYQASGTQYVVVNVN